MTRLIDLAIERDLAMARGASRAIERSLALLAHSPFSRRKAGTSPLIRELIIPFGRSGCGALFSIDDDDTVTVIAMRHQREDDYH